MRDWLFFGLAGVAAAGAIALALVWPAGDAGKATAPGPPTRSTAAR